MNNADLPANPLTGDTYTNLNGTPSCSGSYEPGMGLTKREAFTMAAMQNILSKYNPYEQGDFDSSDYKCTAKHCVGLADAVLRELEK